MEAAQYCRDIEGCVYLGFVAVFKIHDGPVEHGTEIDSLMRDSPLSDSDCLNRFHGTGQERTKIQRSQSKS